LPVWGKRLGAGSLGLSFKYWLISQAIHRAQKRVSFVTGPVELDEEGAALVNDEGPKGKWWGLIQSNRRLRWMQYLDKKLSPLYAELAEVRKALDERPGDAGLTGRHRALEAKILKYSRLKKKDFLGSRFKRFLFLKARRGKHYLKGDSPLEPALNKDLLWIVNVQENILHRGLIPAEDAEVSRSYLVTQSLRQESSDEVLQGLAEEAAQGLAPDEAAAKTELVKGLLADVEFIFDKDRPARQRYLQTLVIESSLVNFFYKLVQWQVDALPVGDGGWWSALFRSSRMHWQTGLFVKYVYEYTDFLRLAATTSSESFRVRYKYEAMEGLLRIFKHLDEMGRIFRDTPSMAEMLDPLKASNEQLRSFQPWREKKSVFSWIPGRRPAPLCAQMWEER
jgi:hypothetical protein